MHSPSKSYFQLLKRVLQYLKYTLHHGLFLSHNTTMDLIAFSNSDWGGSECGGRSTIAYLLYHRSNIISWRLARQEFGSRSSAEVEYKALADAASKVAWAQNLLTDMDIPSKHHFILYCDNT